MNYTEKLKLGLPLSNEKYSIDVVNLNSRLIDSEFAKDSGLIEGLKTDLTKEISRAKTEETAISNTVNNEITRAVNKDNELNEALVAEINRALAIENQLQINKVEYLSPAFSGTPTSPTANAGTNNTQIANTAFVTSSVSDHNVSGYSHNDIRTLISNLTDRLNTVANSDDVSLDQLGEIVAYIKDNRELIDAITTSKVSVSDIVDNLTSTSVNKPLSANQGSVLNLKISNLSGIVDTKANNETLLNHSNDAVRHITSSERVNWNDANSKKHNHTNKSILDGITQADINLWNTVSDKVDGDGIAKTAANAELLDGHDSTYFATATHNHNDVYATSTHNHSAANITSGTLSVERGGTGQTSLINASNSLLNALGTGSDTPIDTDYYISQYVGGGTTTTTYHRRPMSALWTYVKGKADSTYALRSHTHDYASSNHNHSGVYAAVSHTHDYLPLSGGSLNAGADLTLSSNNGSNGILTAYALVAQTKVSASAITANNGTFNILTIGEANNNFGILPHTNNYNVIGSDSKKFYKMYATTFHGALNGNATSATNDSDGNAINTTYLKKSGGTLTAGANLTLSSGSNGGGEIKALNITAENLVTTNNLTVTNVATVGASTSYTSNRLRNISMTTTDPGVGASTTLANGSIICVYE